MFKGILSRFPLPPCFTWPFPHGYLFCCLFLSLGWICFSILAPKLLCCAQPVCSSLWQHRRARASCQALLLTGWLLPIYISWCFPIGMILPCNIQGCLREREGGECGVGWLMLREERLLSSSTGKVRDDTGEHGAEVWGAQSRNLLGGHMGMGSG